MPDKLDLVLQRLDSIDALLERHDKHFDSMETLLQRHDQRLDSIEALLQRHDQRLDSIETRLQRHDKRFDSVEALLRSHGDLLTQLIAIVGVANEKVSEVQADLALIKEGQARQDRILESLAIRSLEQETELREIKRVR